MTYVGSPFEQLPLGQGLPTVTMQDRWNTSLDGWEADIADVVAHLASANAKMPYSLGTDLDLRKLQP